MNLALMCDIIGASDLFLHVAKIVLYVHNKCKFLAAIIRPPLWSSGQSSWIEIQRSSFWFPAIPDFLRSSGSRTGSTQPRKTIVELLGRNSSGSGLENREYCRGNPLRWPRDTLHPQKFALTLPTCGGRSVGIVRLRTKTTEFVFVCWAAVIHYLALWNTRLSIAVTGIKSIKTNINQEICKWIKNVGNKFELWI
jgi:hypothetical protein